MRVAWGTSMGTVAIALVGVPVALVLVMLADQSPAWPLALAVLPQRRRPE